MTDPKIALSVLSDAALVGAVLAAAIGFAGLVFQLTRQALERKETAQTALLAELAHLASHYYHSAALLGYDGDDFPLQRRLRFAKYGEALAPKNLKDYSMLGAQEMAEFLQMSFVCRNNDHLIDELLSANLDQSYETLKILQSRMTRVAAQAERLLQYLQTRNPKMAPVHLDPFFKQPTDAQRIRIGRATPRPDPVVGQAR